MINSLLKKAVDEFNRLDEGPIEVVAHLDADGISSGVILIKALLRRNKKFVLRVVKQLDEKVLNELRREDYKTFIFVDLGSGYINLINKYLSEKKVFIFDHHVPDEEGNGLVHINPHLIGVNDASNTISGSGVTYLFCKELDKQNLDSAYIAIVGAVGDIQEFDGMNNLILKDAIESGKLEIRKGLKMFGYQTRALPKVLMYSTDIYIPGVTGNEEAAVNFLKEIDIKLKNGEDYRTLADLDQSELDRLVTGIILKRSGFEENPEDVVGDIYLLKEENNVVRDVKEFSTLLNSCGRMDKPSLGIGLFFNNLDLRNKAVELMNKYKSELIQALNWFDNNKPGFIEKDKFVIINAEGNVRDTIIGTLCSIISKSRVYKGGKVILGMAYTLDNKIKISARLSSRMEIDLREILRKIVGEESNNVGGHKYACGALIEINDEKKFIENSIKILTKVL